MPLITDAGMGHWRLYTQMDVALANETRCSLNHVSVTIKLRFEFWTVLTKTAILELVLKTLPTLVCS